MASKRKVSNPLALAVMALLFERPMHAYEMVSTMRERHKHEAIRLRYSSLYSVVGALEREALVAELETRRDGRRPERTVYGITEAGRAEFLDWLRELLREPVKEYTQFAAGLSFVAALPPLEAAALLEQRVRRLEEEIEGMRSGMEDAMAGGLARLFLVEEEHELVLREAELSWVRGLVREIRGGTLGGLRGWEAFHSPPDASNDRVDARNKVEGGERMG
jgi:DNA-binding PadR family transcriptional regulator